MSEAPGPETSPKRHFIHQIIDEHIAHGRWGTPGDRSVVRTRFPPEPNGYLHIGHAKSITLNHGLAVEYGGAFILRFDDTNPEKEEQEFVDSITRDVAWMGGAWEGDVRFASDYFHQMYDWAVELIRKGFAYVDEQSAEQIRAGRGTLTEAGTDSPFRDRPVDDSVDLFARMKAGEFADGSKVLRAKVDMASPNLNLRDPVMYRIVNARHHRTGDEWHIYPMYDWAHGLEDSIEGITNSICTLEFENHRPLYDWFIAAINDGRGPGSEWGKAIHHPQQTEFARLNPTFVITSKRKLKQLVDEKHVEGWDDPRMPTISALRRRGYTPEAIRAFCTEIGTTKFNASHDYGLLENAVRDDLNKRAPRRMCVLRPLKVTITNWGEHGDADRVEWMEAVNNPEDDAAGTRQIPFGGTLSIERADFMEDAPKKFFRLKPGGEVRLRYGYWITCNEVIKDGDEVVELRCTYDPQTRGGDAPPPDAEGNVRKVKGTIHWVATSHAVPIEVRLYDRLFTAERPGKATGNPIDDLNPESLEVVERALLEPNWRTTDAEKAVGTGAFRDGIERFQFERLGYFCVDEKLTPDQAGDRPVFNRAVTLKDSWAKQAGK
ncbi:MAG: glutamine--tRNA ligase/YqeY domain fusion protein [Phycisphaeraceae bacterium]|nr:MAG: glutamine--tRNA ligase/YqeY domain fusion protein [Phycisphaeraceae bacterium]